MNSLTRLAEPRVLSENKVNWCAKYLADPAKSPKKRPPSSQYAHKEVVAALRAMSFHKCFYCEQGLGDGEHEVDHYIEVTEDPARAFDWINLYLSCRRCNDKQPNRAIPAADCLDPCDAAAEPKEHLTFEAEIIRAKNNSPTGYQTIRKYGLDRDELNLKRVRQLRRFDTLLKNMLRRMNAEGRTMADGEREILRGFGQPDHPFSLMFSVYIAAEAI
jgi:5-methylcytosine-specific restriction endonuclease McrA